MIIARVCGSCCGFGVALQKGKLERTSAKNLSRRMNTSRSPEHHATLTCLYTYPDNSQSLALLLQPTAILVKSAVLAVLEMCSSSLLDQVHSDLHTHPIYVLRDTPSHLPNHTTLPHNILSLPSFITHPRMPHGPQCAGCNPHQHRKAALTTKAWLDPKPRPCMLLFVPISWL